MAESCMGRFVPGDSSQHGMVEGASYSSPYDGLEEPGYSSSNWYFSRREIEENSLSRRDGVDLKKEAYLRKSYCTFLQDLGMRLKVPQVTIATAIIFSHRFFLRQSHAKNDRRIIATVCMFLAGKVEETPRPLKDVILVSYEIIYKKDPAAVQRIKQKEVYEQQKELILLGERVVLATLGFDFNVHHPYKPLVEAIKKFKVAKNALAQVAWNFVNDGLRTSLCLQFKPHHIAAGAIFLAAKFLKVKLPSDGEKVWWQEFDVTPRQLEEVSNQMLELYEQNRALPSHGSEAEGGSMAGAANPRPTAKVAGTDVAHGGHSQDAAGALNHPGIPFAVDQSHSPSKPGGYQRSVPAQDADHGDSLSGGHEHEVVTEMPDKLKFGAEKSWEESRRRGEGRDFRELKEEEDVVVTSWPVDGSHGTTCNIAEDHRRYVAPDACMRNINKDKVKAALEKRRKIRNDVTDSRLALATKVDIMDEDDFIERELEHGVELAADAEKIKQEGKRPGWDKSLYNKVEQENSKLQKEPGDDDDVADSERKRVSEDLMDKHGSLETSITEEGELCVGSGLSSPRGRKSSSYHDESQNDPFVRGGHDFAERHHKRHKYSENAV